MAQNPQLTGFHFDRVPHVNTLETNSYMTTIKNIRFKSLIEDLEFFVLFEQILIALRELNLE